MFKKELFSVEEEDIDNYKIQINMFLRGNLSKDFLPRLSKTPKFFKYINLTEGYFFIPKHLLDIKQKLAPSHNISFDLIENKLQEMLADPLMILHSSSEKTKDKDCYVIVTNEFEIVETDIGKEKRPIIVAVKEYKDGYNIRSIYRKDDLKRFFNRNVKNLIYIDKEKALKDYPHDLSEHRAGILKGSDFFSKNMITTKEDIVKRYLQEKNMTLQESLSSYTNNNPSQKKLQGTKPF
ncbi:MAG: hypothetical protein LBL00_03270 [Endomicrobium sp.]|jgi:hypothetical protein|nr:hypothetical protein [Endomicrobium sp.]